MFAFIRALHIRSRDNARTRRELLEARELVDRLEIAVRRQQLRIDELATDLERLSDRLTATQGRLLGGRNRKPAQPQQLDLESIPRGDKDSLRRYFRLRPPTPDNDTEH